MILSSFHNSKLSIAIYISLILIFRSYRSVLQSLAKKNQVKILHLVTSKYLFISWFYNTLWVKLCWKVVIGGFTKMISLGPIFLNLKRQIIWRSSSVQFHFWHIFGTSWTQPTAAEAFTIESVSIQAGCRKDVNEVLRTSWM